MIEPVEVPERLREIISAELGVDLEEITLEASFSDDLGADSLDLLEIVQSIESAYNIVIDDEEANKVQTVRDAVVLLHEKSPSSTYSSPST